MINMSPFWYMTVSQFEKYIMTFPVKPSFCKTLCLIGLPGFGKTYCIEQANEVYNSRSRRNLIIDGDILWCYLYGIQQGDNQPLWLYADEAANNGRVRLSKEYGVLPEYLNQRLYMTSWISELDTMDNILVYPPSFDVYLSRLKERDARLAKSRQPVPVSQKKYDTYLSQTASRVIDCLCTTTPGLIALRLKSETFARLN